MSRFASWPKPEGGIPQSVSLFPEWENLKAERTDSDTLSLIHI